jgi:hypothetical protein
VLKLTEGEGFRCKNRIGIDGGDGADGSKKWGLKPAPLYPSFLTSRGALKISRGSGSPDPQNFSTACVKIFLQQC